MNTETQATKPSKPRPEDVSSPDAIIKAMYDCISGPAGGRNWYRLRSLYLDGARLIPTGKRVHKEGGLQVMDIHEWIEDTQGFFAEKDFYELEILRHSDRFGNIIQAFSTYEARNKLNEKPIARGINSIQLLQYDGRWWIVTVMWDNESKDNSIPEQFLPHLW
jgi:hypothetical protein